MSVEFGIDTSMEGATEGRFDKRKLEIASGEERTIKPDLKVTGESSVYMQFTDEQGRRVTESVCSYTESLSGYSTVIIKNDTVQVDENCS
ncbi:hypothetical protein DNH61_04575 [Paenibacillus sambharensis]|uniref:Uncharacterized protein n=1 Tax=Paenibacillus sambharensis TaxID=1803190 RepID=A0A2W1LDI5_9BACL|nr:hypothetical protein [Paenibacillus sambharensis]PZD97166.1 hypothetical protein DNH61_04575 [Paenibacillus sambharensis]